MLRRESSNKAHEEEKHLVRGRTLEERLVDRLLLLYLADEANKIGNLGGKTRVQKFVFLSETDQQRKKLKGYNYGYIRLDYGPYSQDLDNDLTLLRNDGFLSLKGKRHFPTSRTEEILEFGKECLNRNAKIVASIDKTVQKYANIRTDKLLESVYRRKALYHPQKTIRQCNPRTVLLKRLPAEVVTQAFMITESEAATLEILFDPKAVASLEHAQESARTKPSKPWVDLMVSS